MGSFVKSFLYQINMYTYKYILKIYIHPYVCAYMTFTFKFCKHATFMV